MDPIQKSVHDLQKTLGETAVPEAQKPTADELAGHIQRYQEDPDMDEQSLSERLEEALAEFGADHPTLAEALRQAIYDLSNAGV